MKVPLIRFLCLLCLNVLPAAAFAQTCTFGATNLTFSGSPISGAAINGMSTITANCSGLLGLGRKVLVCPNLNEGSGGATAAARRMLSGANILNYQLYQDSARQIVWGSPTWPYPARAPGFLVEFTTILSPLLGSGTNSVTLYGRVLANQTTAPVGTYLSTFSGAQAPFRYRYDDGLGCNAASGTSGSPPAFNVSLMTVKDCLVSAQNINFGSHGVLGANLDQTGQVTVTCSPTTPYAVSLGNGITGTGPTARRMTKGGEFITYGLYRDAARTSPWGNVVPTTTVAGTGTGLAQNLPVYARIPPQATPSPGTYTDTIVVTVTY